MIVIKRDKNLEKQNFNYSIISGADELREDQRNEHNNSHIFFEQCIELGTEKEWNKSCLASLGELEKASYVILDEFGFVIEFSEDFFTLWKFLEIPKEHGPVNDYFAKEVPGAVGISSQYFSRIEEEW